MREKYKKNKRMNYINLKPDTQLQLKRIFIFIFFNSFAALLHKKTVTSFALQKNNNRII